MTQRLFVPIKVRDLITALSRCQADEYLFLAEDGNLRSSFGTQVIIGFIPLSPKVEDAEQLHP